MASTEIWAIIEKRTALFLLQIQESELDNLLNLSSTVEQNKYRAHNNLPLLNKPLELEQWLPYLCSNSEGGTLSTRG